MCVLCVILGFAAGTMKNEDLAPKKKSKIFFHNIFVPAKHLYLCMMICCHKLVVQPICNIQPNKWITVFYL